MDPRPYAVKSIAIDMTRVIKIAKPYQFVCYKLQEIGQPTLEDLLQAKFGKK